MCNAISPERAVIWTVLFDRSQIPVLRAEHFAHDAHARWFVRARDLIADHRALTPEAFADVTLAHERRILKRMLNVAPPPRVRANVALLVQALIDRKAGRRVHIERLIN